MEALGMPYVGSIGGEWMVIGLTRSGREVPEAEAYYQQVLKYIRENVNDKHQLHRAKSTENSRLILALTAMGKDPTDVAGENLLLGYTDMEYVQRQGINGPIWALIALDSGNYPTQEGCVTRGELIDAILDAQLEDGGWALSGEVSDSDMTGMALQALAPYYGEKRKITRAVDKALVALSETQKEDGSFSSVDGPNVESIAQVVVALSALGIDPDVDERFVKNGNSAWDALTAYYVPGGGFCHVSGGKLDGMSTEQAYYAMTACYRLREEKTSLYDMTDIMDRGGDPETDAEELGNAQEPEEGTMTWVWIAAAGVAAAAAALGAGLLLSRKKH